MDKKIINIIDNIVWYIPIKNLRNSVRDLLQNIYEINSNIKYILDRKLVISPFSEYGNIISFQKIVNSDYYDLYKNLIKGLDYNSIITVNRILANIKIYLEDTTLGKNKTKFFSNEDINNINSIYFKFFRNILKLNENCYVYDKYILPVNHFEISVFYYKHNIDSLDKEFIKDRNIIDVGALCGDSAIVFSEYTNKKVYSFEPIKNNYNNIYKTIELNNKNNIVAINKALGSYNGNAKILLSDGGQGIKIIGKEFDNYINKKIEEISIITLDSFVEENNIRVGLIKVDIEGGEQDFLKGAEKTIKTQKPFLLISIYHNAEDFFNIKPLIESWNLDYEFEIYKPFDGHILAETLLICKPRAEQSRAEQSRAEQSRAVMFEYAYRKTA